MGISLPINRKYHTSNILEFSNLVFFIIWFNPMLSSSGLVWWTVLFGYLAIFAYTSKWKIKLDKHYTSWCLIFVFISVISMTWAADRHLVFNALKNMVVQTTILLCISAQIKDRDDFEKFLKIFLYSCICNGIYLLLHYQSSIVKTSSMDVTSRMGDDKWNANTIGMMVAVAAVLAIYFLKKERKISKKAFFICSIILFCTVALRSGSRKAILILILGTTLYLLFVSKGKKIRTIISIILLLAIGYYLVMEVPYFYSIIGWRMEGIFSAISGKGTIDSSTQSRMKYIDAAVETFRQNPVCGVGLDCFRIFNLKITGKKLYAHNNYVEILADLGILGFMSYYGKYFVIGRNLLMQYKKKDNITKLLLIFFIILLIVEYGCVTYNDPLMQFLILLMFIWASSSRSKKGTTDESIRS